MTSTAVSTKPRWLVITPTLGIEGWLEAIRIGAAASNLAIRFEGFGAEGDPQAHADIIVTDDVAHALAAEAETIVALVPAPWTAIDALEGLNHESSTSLIAASRQLAQVSDLDQRHRVIGSDQLRVTGAPLELFADLIVATPAPPAGSASSPARAAASHVLRDFYSTGRAPSQIASDWPVEVFSYDASALIDGRPGDFDLTGRPKFLVSGPYFWMPAGTWLARVRFSIDEAASRRRFRIDWGGTAEWTEAHCTPDHSGLYEMELSHTFAEAQACEIRLLITEGCFTGQAGFHGATVSRVPTPPDA